MADIEVESDGVVTTVTMARPDRRNAVDGPMARELAVAFERFEESDDLVAVLTGAGGTFCAGADLTAVGGERQNDLDADGPAPMGVSRMDLSKPVIAAVEGYAVAGGLELAVWADLRVAAADATFGVFCRRWGVPLIDGGTVRLPRLVGHGRAMDLILTGRPVGAEEALAIGLVTRVVASGTAREEAHRLAHEIARMPQACLRGDRHSAREQWGHDEAAAMRTEFAIGLDSLATDGVAGADRFARGAGRHGSFEDLDG
ncbi:crotonase/enoyl-CoA hydratase family protein [Nocardioides panacisoli]|uniref:crotonase/enoyl-CoA hydratase family protein n=1 Tax=Nocardioides panacisoli TaxID=627624 RepID=UPI001C632EA2|nr:crotonase/enoyl-CoA hydratase family protein [Nocardioides panacisoli]QYJ04156.1 crotonase/enoyl-CoA hydratase family protein [Nocardioides panacisoli]